MLLSRQKVFVIQMNHHHSITRSSTITNASSRRQMTRSISNLNKDMSSSINNNEQYVQVIKPVAVRPPSDTTSNSYNLRSRTKLKHSNNNTIEVIPSFTEKLSLQQKPVPPLTRAAAASAGVKIDSFIYDESIRIHNKLTTTRSSTTRKRKASEEDHRPYLDLLKMKQVKKKHFLIEHTLCRFYKIIVDSFYLQLRTFVFFFFSFIISMNNKCDRFYSST